MQQPQARVPFVLVHHASIIFLFSFFSCASLLGSGARYAIACPSGDHSNAFTLAFSFVTAAASPNSLRRRNICSSSPPRSERNASSFPSGDHRGEDSDFAE